MVQGSDGTWRASYYLSTKMWHAKYDFESTRLCYDWPVQNLRVSHDLSWPKVILFCFSCDNNCLAVKNKSGLKLV